MTMQIKHTL